MTTPRFILASASPARRRLLQDAGFDPIVQPSNFDESQIVLNNAAELVQALARGKAETIVRQLDGSDRNWLIMGCDSVLSLHGEIFGKPIDAADAIVRWQNMRGRVGEIYTGHILIDGIQNRTLVRSAMTQVQFANVSDRVIEAYIATGEPMNSAGCFSIDGRGGLFVEKIVGCHTNVIGLSLPLLRSMLDELGYSVMDFWTSAR
jgi:septum formation protein